MARRDIQSREFDTGNGSAHTADSLLQLGLMYSSGRGVEMDFVAAHKWLNIAALRGNQEARRYRTELSREMSKPEIAQAQRLAREWLTAH